MACLHDHSCEEHSCSANWSLYQHIDLPKVKVLNESGAGSVKSVFKAWERRLTNSESFLKSNEGDPELLVFIPFTSDVKIKSISVVGGAGGTSPSKMRVFINRDGIDFSDTQNMQAVQGWELAENLQGVLEYQTRYPRFQSVANLTLHFPDNFGGETTQIYYIGLQGEATQLNRDMMTKIVYEVMPDPSYNRITTLLLLRSEVARLEEMTFCRKQEIEYIKVATHIMRALSEAREKEIQESKARVRVLDERIRILEEQIKKLYEERDKITESSTQGPFNDQPPSKQ